MHYLASYHYMHADPSLGSLSTIGLPLSYSVAGSVQGRIQDFLRGGLNIEMISEGGGLGVHAAPHAAEAI